MSAAETEGRRVEDIGGPHGVPAAGPDAPAWEMVAAGRYMPRRIRGSFRGRELG